MEAWRRRLAS
jgi:hypothetical protein